MVIDPRRFQIHADRAEPELPEQIGSDRQLLATQP
jgi:hypothetical protein